MRTDEQSARPSARGRRTSVRRLRRGWWIGLLFVAPATILFAIFGVYTIVYGFLLSFARWDGFSPNWTWTGIGNYVALLGGNPAISPTIMQSAGNTLVGMIVLPILVVAIGLALALLLNSITRLRGLMRTVYFVPFVTTGIAVYYAWRFMYQPDGAVNTVLNALGLHILSQPNGWVGNTSTALGAVIAVQVWSNVPIAMLLFLTGLQTIPDGVLEAARVDGASRLRTVWSVILPLLNPITALVIIVELREALQNFQLYLLVSNGGPVNASNTLGLQTYDFAFGLDSAADPGYASALGWLLALVAIILAVVNLRALRSRQ